MTKSGMNLQDSFLNQVRKENTEIMLMLLDGTRLVGYVRGFDNFTVIMNVRGSQHLIYKHAIAQIISRRPQHIEGSEHGGRDSAPQAEGTPNAEPATGEGEPQSTAHENPRRNEGGPRREGRRDEGGHRREGGSRREGGPRREGGQRHEEGGAHGEEGGPGGKPRFNTIDFSAIKIDETKKGSQS